MRTVLISVLATLTITLLIACSPRPIPTNATNDLSFIASEKELASAENANDLGGIAVSISFYKTTSAVNQERVDKLVRHTLSLQFHPVFLYGQPFDQGLVNKLLIVGKDSEDGSGCRPTAWAGIIPKTPDAGKMCGADDNPLSEAKFREWIIDYWKYAKELFLRHK